MRGFPGIRGYLRLRLGGRSTRQEVDDELRFHIARRVEDLMASGLSKEAATARSLSEFGDVEGFAAACRVIDEAHLRELRRRQWLDELRTDLRLALRGLGRSRGFAVVAIATLALGIGAVTSIFTVMSALLLRPLPIAHADRIVMISETARARPERETTTSYPMYDELVAGTSSYDAIAVIDDWSPSLTGAGEPERLDGALVTAEALRIFGVTPVLGRAMEASDNVQGAERIALLAHGLWQRKFGGDVAVVGRTITVNGGPRTVIGVLPASFRGAAEMEAEIYGNNYRDDLDTYGSRYLRVYARLRPDVPLETARAELNGLAERLEREQPRTNAGMTLLATPLREVLVGDTRQALILVFAASLLLLLIACANLSGILVARGLARMREFAIRSVLGASRRRAIRQLLTESLCLCLLGTAAGVALAIWSQRMLLALAPEAIRPSSLRLDWRVLLFCIGVVVLATLLTGLLPALRASRVDLQSVLKAGGRGTVSGGARLRKLLVAGQIALALALLAGAGLLIESFRRVQRVNAGIDPRNVLVLSMNLPASRYPAGTEPQFFERLLADVHSLPGVRSAAVTSIVPFSTNWDRIVVDVEGRIVERGTEKPEGDRFIVSREYFQTLGVSLREGRLFDARDVYDGQLVAIVDESFGRQIAEGASPLGMRIKLPGRDSMAQIVGVVGHVKQYGLDLPSQGQIYMSHVQYPWRYAVMAVKAEGDPLALVPAVRAAVQRADPDQPVFDLATVERLMKDRLALRRFLLVLMVAFAAAAVTLAIIGVYGALAYVVALRRPEIGLRAVLGAAPAQLVRMVVAEGMRVGLAGSALGLAGAAAGTRVLRQLLFGVQPFEPRVMLVVVALMLALACSACLLPAWRAARVDPAETLTRQ